jgi:crossover junction endodeoxyribonuclease RusA
LIKFTVYGNPVPKQRPRLGAYKTYTPKRTKDWERLVGWSCLRDNPGLELLQGGVSASYIFYRRNRRKCDLDNLIKGINDGLNGVAFVDDTQVTEIYARLEYDRDNPRVEVELKQCN